MRTLMVVVTAAACLLPAGAAGAQTKLRALDDIGIHEHPGGAVPLDVPLRDSHGRAVRLGDYFTAGRPVVLVLAYFQCPMLCGMVLGSTAQALRALPWEPGRDYEVVTLSFDPRDRDADAAEKRATALEQLGRGESARLWPFLTGSEAPVKRVTDALGFVARYDASTGQFAHDAAIFVLTPGGTISRYLHGASYRASDVKLALVEAGEGHVGSAFDRVVMHCYRYDPSSRKYAPYVAGIMRTGGVAILGALGLVFAGIGLQRRRKAGNGG